MVYGCSADVADSLRQALNENYKLFTFSQALLARDFIERQALDLAIIDPGVALGLDPNDAFQLCQFLRARPGLYSLPVFFVSGLRETALVVRAFQSGADDFVTIPFAPEEFLARIEARFKRLNAQPPVHDLFWKADLRFSLGTQRVVCTDAEGEHDLELTPNEFKILYLLARNEGQVLSRPMILSEVWGENLHVVERTVDKHVCSLRRKMGARSHYVASVPGTGYCFNPNMTMRTQFVKETIKEAPLGERFKVSV